MPSSATPPSNAPLIPCPLFFKEKKKKKRKYIPQMLLIRIAKMSSTISHGEKNPLKKKKKTTVSESGSVARKRKPHDIHQLQECAA
jgi:hypothetical protein